jgi:hypothetical protein
MRSQGPNFKTVAKSMYGYVSIRKALVSRVQYLVEPGNENWIGLGLSLLSLSLHYCFRTLAFSEKKVEGQLLMH